MVLVDSNVRIDFFRNIPTEPAEWLDRNLGSERLVIGDLILTEVLQGFRDDRSFDAARRMLGTLEKIEIAGFAVAIDAGRNYRKLRSLGITLRGTVDVLIETRCITSGLRLLHDDRDFDAFEKHIGLRVVDCSR